MNGTVSAFDESTGLGEVTGADGRPYAFHCVEIADGGRYIDLDTSVEFVVLAKLGAYEAACLTRR